MSQFLTQLGNAATAVEAFLADVLAEQEAAVHRSSLAEALRHAVLAGGKRFRPFLVFQSAALFGVTRETALPPPRLSNASIAIPSSTTICRMDNDELRRGQPTVWKAYDEWTAILVGDALQAFAFELISGCTEP